MRPIRLYCNYAPKCCVVALRETSSNNKSKKQYEIKQQLGEDRLVYLLSSVFSSYGGLRMVLYLMAEGHMFMRWIG